MKIKYSVVGIAMTFLVINIVFADTSTSYSIDMSTMNGSGTVSSSDSYQVNDTFVGFIEGGITNSTSYSLGSGLVYLEVLCGNGILEMGEQCDDGNTSAGDGCSSTCEVEPIACGNGLVEAGEECDDGNTNSGDGCSSVCTTEVITPPTPPPVTGGGGFIPLCGNGILNTGEQCEDGNRMDGDGCSSICRLEVPLFPVCGNSMIELGEECDDGNTIGQDGCSATCEIEIEITPIVIPICGNGRLEVPEECDDGNIAGGDGCSSFCKMEIPEEIRTIKIKARPEKRVNPTQNWGVQSQIVFYHKASRKMLVSAPIPINNIGWGIMETSKLPDGEYDIALKGLSHLTKVIRNVELNEALETIDFTLNESFYLLAGDVHESKDNFVNGLDISATVRNIYADDIHADLNRDGMVNGLDIGITVANLYKYGDYL